MLKTIAKWRNCIQCSIDAIEGASSKKDETFPYSDGWVGTLGMANLTPGALYIRRRFDEVPVPT